MTSHQAFVTIRHSGPALARLRQAMTVDMSAGDQPLEPAAFAARLTEKDAVISVLQDRLGSDIFSAFPRLKLVANVAVGYDNIDIQAATGHGVLVLNTPGVLDDSVADFAFALLMAVSRRVVEADKYVRSGQWNRWGFDLLLGTDIRGKTLGIIGLGRIGQAVARRAAGFGMNILYNQRHPAESDFARQHRAEFVPLEQLLKQSDYISIHCPLNSHTKHLIAAEQFALMKESCYLINTARGAVIDEQALIVALKSGRIKGAALDVFEHEPSVPMELLQMDNVVLAPHIGSASEETRAAMVAMAMDGTIAALSGHLPGNAVNPECWPQFLEKLAAARF